MKSSFYQQRLLHQALLAAADKHPQKIAVWAEGKPYSYKQLWQGALRMASALRSRGLQRGDRVAIYMDNTWASAISIYGTLIAGGVFLMVNPQTKKEKLRFIVNDSESSFLLTDGHLARHFLPILNELPSLKGIIASGIIPANAKNTFPIEAFDDVLAKENPLKELPFVNPNDLAALIYTSGSTGFPKGVMQTHRSMVFASWSIIEYLRLSEDERIMLMLPLAFDYGLYQLFMTVNLGATLIMERSFIYPSLIYQRIEEFQATVFPGVPTIYATLIEAHKKSQLRFPSITCVTNTAAALPVEFLGHLKEIFPNALIFKMYGLTECKRVAYLEPELLDEKPASVGKAIPGTEVFLRSPDGEPTPVGKAGILYVRGPHIMAGYWKRPEQTNRMLHPGEIPGERILCTYDWFKMDEDGFLYFIGRSDDIIKTRGEKVSPLEVEQVLHSVNGVKEAAVIGIPDDVLGEAICAFVVAQPEVKLDERIVKKICAQRLENFMVPKKVVFLDQMPKSPNGKIDKKKLNGVVANGL